MGLRQDLSNNEEKIFFVFNRISRLLLYIYDILLMEGYLKYHRQPETKRNETKRNEMK